MTAAEVDDVRGAFRSAAPLRRLRRAALRLRRALPVGRLVPLLAAITVALGIPALNPVGATGTLASWTDPTVVSGTTIGTASVDLRVQGLDTVTAFTSMNTSALTPGASVAGVLTVRNNGNVPLTYHVGATATNADAKALAAALAVKVTGASSVTGTTPNRTCGGTNLSDSATAFTSPFLGSAASPRLLAANSQETVCVQASLAGDAPTSLQTATTAVSFSVSAEGVPVSPWKDAVPVSGTSIGTATISTPTMGCGAELANKQVVVNWPAMPGATGYRLYYGTGGSESMLLSSSTTSYPFKYSTQPLSGTASLQAIYGSATWTSDVSNTRNYYVDNTTATCS